MDGEQEAGTPARGIQGRPTCLITDPFVHGRAWCGTHRDGVFRSDDGGRSWHSVGLAGQLITALSASRARPERGLVRHRAEPGLVFKGRRGHLGADHQAGDAALVVRMVISAETGYSSRSLDCVSPARIGTTVDRDRGWSPRVHNRRRSHMERPSGRRTMGHPRTRHSQQRARHTARLRRRWILRESRCRRDLALA
jgi:hypothetical protein